MLLVLLLLGEAAKWTVVVFGADDDANETSRWAIDSQTMSM